MVKFAYTILYVSDVDQALTFYEKAFGFQRKFISPQQDYAELISGETTLSLASKKLAATNLPTGFIESRLNEKPFAIELGFTTDEVDNTIAQALKAGAVLVEKPKQKPWGQTVAYLRDLDGFLIEICTPMG
ncbi:VOC family protein [Pedobacter sp. ASV28]|uniref:VOC family protein n=1 Tax=Pedobacter sp. ASV28 TaxID=2795123 RepID=UPI0018ECF280|nr:VOC family protein [Pedobacter sp. ASV28]